MSLSEFKLFPELPAEIRLKIWALALPPPRLIHARIPFTYSTSRKSYDCSHSGHLFILTKRPPSLLDVCSESRAFFLTKYESGFHVTRSLDQYRARPGSNYTIELGSEDQTRAKHRYASYNMFFPCYHELMVGNMKRPVYWDPQKDIVFLHIREENPAEDNQDKVLAETAFVWSTHGWCIPRIRGVKNVAMSRDTFTSWATNEPESRIFEEVKTVYVILDRGSCYTDENWERKVTKFKRWYQKFKLDRPSQIDEERKMGFNLKILQSIEGALDDAAFDAAVPEQDIVVSKDGPDLGTWKHDEDSDYV